MKAAKVIVKLGLIAGISALGFGLYSLYKQQIYYLKQYCYKIHSFVPTKFSAKQISFDLTIKLLNRSSFALNLESYSFDVFLQGKYITSVSSSVLNVINPKAVSYINVGVNVIPGNIVNKDVLAQVVGYYITDKSKIIISLKGDITASSSFIRVKKLPVDFSDTLENLMNPSNNSDKMVCPENF
jgi:LEA14-like dessication related protein